MVLVLTATPCAFVPMMVPELLIPPVMVELATVMPVTPVIEPLFVMLLSFELATETPAADRPLIRPELFNAPMIVELATEMPVAPAIVPLLLIEPLMVLVATCTPATEP